MTDSSDPFGPRALFRDDGTLDRDQFAPRGLAVLEACLQWLQSIERGMLLPIDLIAVLMQRGDPALLRTIARITRGRDDAEGLVDQLQTLARRVDRQGDPTPKLHIEHFSLGLVGILDDALAWAREAGRRRIDEPDIVRVVRWRAELQDSASVRWALRQLAQPGDERLFDADGALRGPAFASVLWSHLQAGMLLAHQAGMPFLGTPHAMAAVASHEGGPMARAARKAGVDPIRLRDELLRIVGKREPGQPPFTLGRRTLTPRLVRMMMVAAERLPNPGDSIGETEFLEAFLEDGGTSLDLVNELGIGPHLRAELSATRIHAADADLPPGAASERPALAAASVLDQLGRDLTAEARDGKLPTVLGREAELQRVINVLLRQEQRNPLLTGEAGVGKTALAAALAQRIVDGTVPKRLRNMRVVELNGASLVGGTSYRGELEARIRAILAEAEDNVLLFMDEAHAVFSPRLSSGQPAEVPNHFKSALAAGRIAVVAATTEAEYHRWIEQDPALQRRFERIVVPEMSPELTARILRDLAPEYEEAYEVPIAPESVDAAIELSTRFMPESALPDKAKKLFMDSVIAVSSDLAARPTTGAMPRIHGEGTPSRRMVVRADVAAEVARKTGIPLDRILGSSSPAWWHALRLRLQPQTLGRNRVVETLTRTLMEARLRDPKQHGVPTSLALVGPVGSGRTRLARALATELFGSDDALLHLDLSDYQEAHSISRLIGTAPGYVGYQDEDALVTPLRRRPASVVLLQAFHLAHPRVQERFLRLFAEGSIADMRGLRADARHAVFLLTIDTAEASHGRIGFGGSHRRSSLDTLPRDTQELLERLGDVGVTPIDFTETGDLESYLDQWLEEQLQTLAANLASEFNQPLNVDEDTRALFRQRALQRGTTQGLDRLLRELVLDPLTDRLLSHAADAAERDPLGPAATPERRADSQPALPLVTRKL